MNESNSDSNDCDNEQSLAEEEFISYDQNKDFTSLKAWQKGREVKLFFYREILPLLPKTEIYRLGAQIRDASVSVTANIAEGYGRYHYQEAVQFYRISRGSLYELKDHLISCVDIEYIDQKLFNTGKELIEQAKRTLNGYIKYTLQQKKNFKHK